MYAGDEFYDDDMTSGFDSSCVACDGPLTDDDHSGSVCDECSGLAHCIDDICYGQGYCMHNPNSWRP